MRRWYVTALIAGAIMTIVGGALFLFLRPIATNEDPLGDSLTIGGEYVWRGLPYLLAIGLLLALGGAVGLVRGTRDR
jgi:phosphotransferase system  glucose/maltose/N-acetylglucosamine-specific IIC component